VASAREWSRYRSLTHRSHIDTAWLWRYTQTQQKVSSTALHNVERAETLLGGSELDDSMRPHGPLAEPPIRRILRPTIPMARETRSDSSVSQNTSRTAASTLLAEHGSSTTA